MVRVHPGLLRPRYANWQSDPARAPTRSVGRRMIADSIPGTAQRVILGTDEKDSSVGNWQTTLTQNQGWDQRFASVPGSIPT